MPTAAEKRKAIKIMPAFKTKGIPNTPASQRDAMRARAIPIRPPKEGSTPASTRNCISTSCSKSPMANAYKSKPGKRLFHLGIRRLGGRQMAEFHREFFELISFKIMHKIQKDREKGSKSGE